MKATKNHLNRHIDMIKKEVEEYRHIESGMKHSIPMMILILV